MIKRVILILTIFISFVMADNSLELKIAQLQTAPKDKKYIIMNQIKRELANMNVEQRSRALNQLKATIHTAENGMHKHNNSTHLKTREHIQEHLKHNETHLLNKHQHSKFDEVKKSQEHHHKDSQDIQHSHNTHHTHHKKGSHEK